MEGPEAVVIEKYDHDNITCHAWNNKDPTESLRIGALGGLTLKQTVLEGKRESRNSQLSTNITSLISNIEYCVFLQMPVLLGLLVLGIA